jgi:hypothetical protein
VLLSGDIKGYTILMGGSMGLEEASSLSHIIEKTMAEIDEME